jgi:hypothetical protein
MARRVFPSIRAIALSALCVGMLLSPAIPRAKADLWNERTVVTFDKPVEIPGKVLIPGTYVFKVFDSDSNRDLVQIYTQDERQLVASVEAVAAYRQSVPSDTIITFEERSTDSPEAIHQWFYPGDNYGHQFVYNR